MHFPLTFPFEYRFLISLFVTIVVETAVLIGLIKLVFKIPTLQLTMKRCVFAGFFASFATLPYLGFVLPVLIHSYPLLLICGECGVFIIETIAYVYLLNLPIKKTVILSFVANSASILVGLVVIPPF